MEPSRGKRENWTGELSDDYSVDRDKFVKATLCPTSFFLSSLFFFSFLQSTVESPFVSVIVRDDVHFVFVHPRRPEINRRSKIATFRKTFRTRSYRQRGAMRSVSRRQRSSSRFREKSAQVIQELFEIYSAQSRDTMQETLMRA